VSKCVQTGWAWGCAALALATTASAAITPDVLIIEVTNGTATANWDLPLASCAWDPGSGALRWSTSTALPLLAEDGTTVAELRSANIAIWPSRVDASISFIAGNSTTEFRIDTSKLSFALIPAGTVQARASASFSVADRNSNGATLRGLGTPGSGAYRAKYNDYYGDGGALFSQLVGLIVIGPGGSATVTQRDPNIGYRSVGYDVYNMFGQMAFSLTPGDWVSANTLYECVPAPLFADCNGNGAPDDYDIARGTSTDQEGNGVPDECECSGDINEDTMVDNEDLTGLLDAWGTTTYDDTFCPACDLNADDQINNGDLQIILDNWGLICLG
jgi:hypothetical protein